MGLQLHWVGESDLERVARTRMLCYAPAGKDLPSYIERIRGDPRADAMQHVLASRDGRDVGVASSIDLTMWVRGAPVSCQGVATVGTIRTERRKGGEGAHGVASAVMREMLRYARERQFIVSALMPFRASFYEHFGYGLVERRRAWTLPLAVIPNLPTDGVRFYEPGDFEALCQFKQRLTESGQCDIERSGETWQHYIKQAEKGFMVVDRIGDDRVRGSMYWECHHHDGQDTLRVVECIYEDIGALKRLLSLLGSMRDQYSTARIILPADLQLNWLLKERQMTPHFSWNHATAEARPFTRMQVRVLDHTRLLSAIRVPAGAKGRMNVAIQETEGEVSKIAIDISEGRIEARASTGKPDVECRDTTWAAIVLGDLTATEAARMGLIQASDSAALEALGAFSLGPPPCCLEYF